LRLVTYASPGERRRVDLEVHRQRGQIVEMGGSASGMSSGASVVPMVDRRRP
jgi:hypothetical protein